MNVKDWPQPFPGAYWLDEEEEHADWLALPGDECDSHRGCDQKQVNQGVADRHQLLEPRRGGVVDGPVDHLQSLGLVGAIAEEPASQTELADLHPCAA